MIRRTSGGVNPPTVVTPNSIAPGDRREVTIRRDPPQPHGRAGSNRIVARPGPEHSRRTRTGTREWTLLPGGGHTGARHLVRAAASLPKTKTTFNPAESRGAEAVTGAAE